jgi:hypothetical protein
MPEYLSPGVYVEEISGGIKPIEGVGTSTGAFVGVAEKGPINSAQLITNFTQFRDTFGEFLPDAFLAYAVNHFFTEGGTRCYVVRAFNPTGGDARNDTAKRVYTSMDSPPSTMTVYAVSPGEWGNDISVKVGPVDFDPDAPPSASPPIQSKKFKLQVYFKAPGADSPALVETFDLLSLSAFIGNTTFPNPNFVERRINGVSKYITVRDVSINEAMFDASDFPSALLPLTGGTNGGAVTTDQLIGAEATATASATGLHAFDAVDDINIVAIPDLVNPDIADAADARDATIAGFTYCENRKDCFFVADSVKGLSPQDVLKYKRGTDQFSGNAFKSTYGALYYPWIFVSDPLTSNRKLVPPSGAVAGTYSATDVRRGVHKAPAGTEDGFLNTAVEIERAITKGEQDTLNPAGVNVIRKFPESGIVIWGARTVATDPEWKYVNVRRLFLFLEESIDEGTQWVVFEPNDKVLWRRIVRNVSAFLRIQWLEGKLVGDKPEKAFFVKCDEETNPPESVDLGRVITVIGVAPSKPAEFVIFRIMQTRPGEQV